MDHAIISRTDALARGLKRYFTGEPCKRGHVAERSVTSYVCIRCAAETRAARRRADPSGHHEKDRHQREKNPERIRANLERYRDANRDLINARMRSARAETGPQRDARLARKREYRAVRREDVRAAGKAYRDTHKEQIRKRAASFRQKNPELHRERSRQWRENNPEKRKLYEKGNGRLKALEWQGRNKEKLREYQRTYRTVNKEAKYASIHKRRALKKQSSGQYTGAEAKAILIAQKHKCVYCEVDLRKVKKHLDHIIPLSRGGLNDKTNIQWLCEPCNLRKHDKDPIAWANEIGKLL